MYTRYTFSFGQRTVTLEMGELARSLPAQPFSTWTAQWCSRTDPAQRDRIAFVRVWSGRFGRGMKLKVSRSGKDLRTTSAVSFLSQEARAPRRSLCG